MTELIYNRKKAVEYAHNWAFKRNQDYYDFSAIGGDCTNFCSQCIFAGSDVMNYNANLSWYYNSVNSRSPSWAGVQFLYNFLIYNKGVGPHGRESKIENIFPGDIVQISFDGIRFTHSPVIVDINGTPTPENILVATHTYDSDNRPLDTYSYKKLRFIHIDGVRKN